MHNLIKLLISFLKVGLFGYGGGPSLIPLIQEEVVNVHKWLTVEEFIDALAIGNSLPGPIAIKLAALVGYQVQGLIGALIGITAICAPGTVGILVFYFLLKKYQDVPLVQGALKGVRPAVIAMLAWTIYTLFPASVTSFKAGILMVLSFVVITFLNVHPIFAVIGAALVGILLF